MSKPVKPSAHKPDLRLYAPCLFWYAMGVIAGINFNIVVHDRIAGFEIMASECLMAIIFGIAKNEILDWVNHR